MYMEKLNEITAKIIETQTTVHLYHHDKEADSLPDKSDPSKIYYVIENSGNVWRIKHLLSGNEKSIKINEPDGWWIYMYPPYEKEALGINK